MSVTQKSRFRQALKNELERYSWDMFITGTFADERTDIEARKSVVEYFQSVEKRLQAPVPRFWVLEPHQHRKTLHMHSLLLEVNQISEDVPQILWSNWRKYSNRGRFRSEGYDAKKGGAGYLTKYITKSITDWDIANLDKVNVFHKQGSLVSEG